MRNQVLVVQNNHTVIKNQAIGPSNGGLRAKIHVTVDALGNRPGLPMKNQVSCPLDRPLVSWADDDQNYR
jgi:hypothetical protein